MKKKFSLIKFFLGILVIAIAVLTAVPYFLSFEEYRGQIVSAIKNSTGQNVLIRGDISARLLPLPEVRIEDIYLSQPTTDDDNADDITAVTDISQIKIRLGLFALLSGDHEITRITLVSPSTTWENIRNIRSYWNSQVQSGKTNDALIATLIENGRIYFGDARKRSTTRIRKINAEIDAGSASGPYVVAGDFIINKNKFSFNADISLSDEAGDGDSTWNFIGDGFEVTFKGDLVGKKGSEDNTLSGTLQARSNDFDYIIAKYFQGKQVLRATEEGDKDDAEPANPILAEGKLTYSQKLIRIEDFAISSNYISGSGRVSISTEKMIPDLDLSLIFESIDLDKFIESPEHKDTVKEEEKPITAETFIAQTQETEGFYEQLSRIIGGVATEVNVLADVSIKSLTYNKEQVKNIVLNADMFSGDFAINEFTALMPGNSFFEVIGTIKHNEIRPRFSGEVALAGDSLQAFSKWLGVSLDGAPEDIIGKYKFNTDLVLLPQKINLSGLDLSVDETSVNGSMVLRYGGRAPKLITNLNVSELNLDSYGLSAPITNTIITYFKSDPNNQKTRNFNWLRSLKGQFGGELVMENITFNGTKYKELSSLFAVNPGKLRIEKLDLDSKPAKLSSSLTFDITSIRPKVSLSIAAETLDTSAFIPKIDEKKEEKAPSENATGEGETPDDTATEEKPAGRWPSEDIYFFDLGRFDGTVEVNASNFKHKNIDMKNLKFAARLYEGTIGFDNFTADYSSGNMIVKGIMNIEELPNIAVTFALNNIKAEDFRKTFTDIDTISGYVSASGSIVTFGKSYADWVKNAKSNLVVLGRQVNVDNFSINDLATKSEEATTAKQLGDIAVAAATNGTTTFETLESQVQVTSGMLDFTGMKVATKRVSGVMNGRVDIINWLMNIIGQFAYITVDSRDTVTLSLNVTGKVNNPERTFGLDDLLKKKGIAVAPSKRTTTTR